MRLTLILFISLCPVVGGFSTLQSQSTYQADKDSLKAFEIPYIVGESEFLINRVYKDINALKSAIDEELKGRIFSYIYEAFTDSSKAVIQSELSNLNDIDRLRNNAPISLDKYLIDFELHSEIMSIEVIEGSFMCSFPEKVSDSIYEMYGAFRLNARNADGFTLNDTPIEKLTRFVIERNEDSSKPEVRVSTMSIMNPAKLPDFLEEEELEALSQEYLKWRDQGAIFDNAYIMGDGDIREILSIAKNKRQEKEAAFRKNLNAFESYFQLGDVLSSIEYFIASEKLRRNDWNVLKYKELVIKGLDELIRDDHQRLIDASRSYNFPESERLKSKLELSFDYWYRLNSYEHSNKPSTVALIDQVDLDIRDWKKRTFKLNNSVSAIDDYKKELEESLYGVKCDLNEENPELAVSFTVLAMAEQKTSGNTEQSSQYLNESIRCKSDFVVPKLDLINLLQMDDASAVRLYDDILYYEPNNPKLYHLRGQALKAQNRSKAYTDFNKCLEIDPTNEDCLKEYSFMLFEDGKYSESIDYLTRLNFFENSEYSKVLLLYALLEKEQGESEKAKTLSREINYKSIRDINALLTLDSLYQEYQDSTTYHRFITGDVNTAVSYFERMLLLGWSKKSNYMDWEAAAKTCYEAGQLKKALQFSDSAIAQTNNNSIQGYLISGSVYRELKEYDLSKKMLYKAISLQNSEVSNYELAETYFQAGLEYGVARSYFLKAAELTDKEDDDIIKFMHYLRLGQCFRFEKNLDKSVLYLNAASKIINNDPTPYFELSNLYLELGDNKTDFKKGFEAAAKAEKLNFDRRLVLRNKARASFAMQDYQSACTYFEQIDEILKISGEKNFLSPSDWKLKAESYFFNDKLDKSLECLTTAAQKVPNYYETSDYNIIFGFAMLKKVRMLPMSPKETNKFLSQAREAFRKANEASIRDAEPYLGLSIAYYIEKSEDYTQYLDHALMLNLKSEHFENDKYFESFFKEKEVKNLIKSKSRNS